MFDRLLREIRNVQLALQRPKVREHPVDPPDYPQGFMRVSGGAPPMPTLGPHARHVLERVRQGSWVRDFNTIIEPWIDVEEDVRLVLAGLAQRVGNDYVVNGRTYGVHNNGRVFPRHGPGFRVLDRATYKALGVYNQFGVTTQAEDILGRMHDQTPETRATALDIHQVARRREDQ